AGGFALVVIDFGTLRFPLSQSASLRLARAAERSGAAVLVLAEGRPCGTFAALTLATTRLRAHFSREGRGGPALFHGLHIEAAVARNKLGVFGDRTRLSAVLDPLYSSELTAADNSSLANKPSSTLTLLSSAARR